MTLKSRSNSPTAAAAIVDLECAVHNEKEEEKTRKNFRIPPFLYVAVAFGLGLLVASVSVHNDNVDLIRFSPFSNYHRHDHIYDVVIIGAGWAGIAAANHLKELGVDNIQVLEAHDTPGGRSRTVYPFANQPNLAVEIGSAWTYDDTEVHELLLKEKLPYGEVHYDDTTALGLYDKNGEIRGKHRKHLEHLWKDYCQYSKDRRGELKNSQSDKSYRSILDHYLTKHKLNQTDTEFLNTMIQAQVEIEYAAPADQISGTKVGHHVNECIFCDADYYVPVENGGFDKILKPLLDPIRKHINFQRIVTYIDSNQGKVVYTDPDGQEHIQYAKTILVTVPLGVLRKETIEFNPPLSQAKKDAMNVVGFGVLNKCILYWEKDQSSWWPKGKEVLEFVNEDVSFSTFFNEKELGNGGHHILSAWIGGNEAVAIEQQTDEDIINKVLSNLQSMLGATIPKPTQHVISRWGSDKFSYGSYSFNSVARDGLVSIARRELRGRTGEKVFWAGEATHESWYGTTVGAYRSGITAAEDISLTLQHRLDPAAASNSKK